MVLAFVKPKDLGTVVVGMDLRQVLMKLIIDKKYSENNLKFFEAKVVMRQEQLFFQLEFNQKVLEHMVDINKYMGVL
jgi:hypothetical protein